MWDTIKKYITPFSFNKLLPSLIALIAGLIIAKLLCKAFQKVLVRSKLEPSLHSFLCSLFRILVYLIVFLIVASTMGFDLTSLIAVLSVLSLAISLAVQGTLANIAGGIQILASHPFKKGDFVEVGGNSGTIKEIRLSYTVLTTTDNREVFIPNSDAAGARIINYNAEGKRRVDILVDVGYGYDTELVKKALLECCEQKEVLSDPAAFAALNEYRDSTVQYVIRVWCKTEDYWTVNFAIRERLQDVLTKHGIEMSYPHINVHMDK